MPNGQMDMPRIVNDGTPIKNKLKYKNKISINIELENMALNFI